MKMFYLQKEGKHFHGVFWIGETLEEGIIEADKHALADGDNYHDWCVFEYSHNEGVDDESRGVYEIDKHFATEKIKKAKRIELKESYKGRVPVKNTSTYQYDLLKLNNYLNGE